MKLESLQAWVGNVESVKGLYFDSLTSVIISFILFLKQTLVLFHRDKHFGIKYFGYLFLDK